MTATGMSPDLNLRGASIYFSGTQNASQPKGQDSEIAYISFAIPESIYRYGQVSSYGIHIEGAATSAGIGAYAMHYATIASNTDIAETITWNNSGGGYSSQMDYSGSIGASQAFSLTAGGTASLNQPYLILQVSATRWDTSAQYSGYINWQKSYLDVTYVDNRPVSNFTNYPTRQSSTHDFKLEWSYLSNISSKQSKYTIDYQRDGGAWTRLISEAKNTQSYTVPANTLTTAGNYKFRIQTVDSNSHTSVASISTNTTVIYNPIPQVSLDWQTVSLNQVATLPLTWSFKSEDSNTQTNFTIQWSSNNGTSWTTISQNTEDQYYTFAMKAFPVGTIKLRFQVTDSAGWKSALIEKTFTVYKQTPVVTCGYPSNVAVSTKNTIIATWSYVEEIVRGQASYELMWSSDNGSTWTTITETTSNQYYSFAVNTFPTGTILWKIRAKDIDGTWSEWNSTSFEAIGQTSAPVITSVSNSSVPTISWTVSSQDCFEINIRKENELIYASQLIIGASTRSYKVPVMLENGFYSAEMRVLNSYGVYTEWTTYSFRINLSAPAAPTSVDVYLESDYSISISGTGATGVQTYAVRKDNETNEVKLLGSFIGNEIRDYSVPLNKSYSYSLRSYGGENQAGYTDGRWVPMNIKLENHVLIHASADRSKYVDIFKSSDHKWNVGKKNAYTRSYFFTIGRKYPVCERTIWDTSTRTISAWVSDADLETLEAIENEDVYFRTDKEAFLADMTLAIGETYAGGGRFVTITITRLSENEVSVL